jgi:hypothetical protein
MWELFWYSRDLCSSAVGRISSGQQEIELDPSYCFKVSKILFMTFYHDISPIYHLMTFVSTCISFCNNSFWALNSEILCTYTSPSLNCKSTCSSILNSSRNYVDIWGKGYGIKCLHLKYIYIRADKECDVRSNYLVVYVSFLKRSSNTDWNLHYSHPIFISPTPI